MYLFLVQCGLLQLKVELASKYISPGFFFVASHKRVSQLVHATPSPRVHLCSWQHYLGKEILTMAKMFTSVNQ